MELDASEVLDDTRTGIDQPLGDGRELGVSPAGPPSSMAERSA
jgi:hypothetical protein